MRFPTRRRTPFQQPFNRRLLAGALALGSGEPPEEEEPPVEDPDGEEAAPVPAPGPRRYLVPKLRVPLAMGQHGLEAVEQGTADEVAACVYAIVATTVGSRVELPAFGVEDPTFEQLPLNLQTAILSAVARWEPRATVTSVQEVEELVDNIVLEVAT